MSCFRVSRPALLRARADVCAGVRAAEAGQSTVDYAMLTAVVIAAVAVAYQFVALDQLIQTVFNRVTAALD